MQKTSISVQPNLFDVEMSSKKLTPKKESSYVFDIVDALSAPVLTFSHQWSDTIPKRMLDIVPLARMKALMQGEQLATYTECVIYIYTRTLEAPMDSEWTDIYTHISCKTLEEWFVEDHWKDTEAPRELSEWLCSKLKGQFKTQEHTKKKIPEKEKNEITTQQQRTLFP
jgi:hypothetical protein